jgi:hypothetical protein
MGGLFIDEFLDEADHTGMVRFVSSPRTSVGPSFPVTCAPVFDRKESAGLEVMIKQGIPRDTGNNAAQSGALTSLSEKAPSFRHAILWKGVIQKLPQKAPFWPVLNPTLVDALAKERPVIAFDNKVSG